MISGWKVPWTAEKNQIWSCHRALNSVFRSTEYINSVLWYSTESSRGMLQESEVSLTSLEQKNPVITTSLVNCNNATISATSKNTHLCLSSSPSSLKIYCIKNQLHCSITAWSPNILTIHYPVINWKTTLQMYLINCSFEEISLCLCLLTRGVI